MKAADAPEFFNFASGVMDGWARTQPHGLALWCVDARTGAEQKFTFGELAALSRRAANVFRKHGLRRGDRVLVMLPRISQWWIAMLGLIRLGAVPIPATLQLSARDVTYRLETGQVRGVVTNVDAAAKVIDFDGIGFSVGGVAASGWVDFDGGLRSSSVAFTNERTRSTDPGILYFTSATTGEPKMVLHTQASYGLATV